MHTRRIVCAALACGSLLLTSCGGDEPGDTSPPTTIPEAEANALAAEGLLTAEDLGAGFVPSADDDAEDEAGEDDSAFGDTPECAQLAAVDEEIALSGEADADFERADPFAFVTQVIWYGDEQATQQSYDLWASSGTSDCLLSVFEQSAAGDEEVSIQSASLLPTSLEPTENDARYDGTLVLVRASDGFSISFDVFVAFQRAGSSLSMVMTLSPSDTPLDVDAVTARVIGRLGAVA